MINRILRRRGLLPAMLVTAMTTTMTPVIHAGDVTVSAIDLKTGTAKTYVTGSAQHKPVYLLETKDNDVRLIDTCGHVYMPKRSPFGERELVDMNFPDKSIRDIRLFITPGRGRTFGIGQDGKPWMLMTQFFDYDKPDPRALTKRIDSPFDFSKVRHFIPGMGEVPDLALFEDGGMLGTRDTLGEDDAQARFVAPRNGWGKIQHGTPIYVGSGRERRVILLTIDADGQLVTHTPVEEEDGFDRHVTSMESKPIGNTKFTDTKRLFAGRYDEVAYRWTKSGDLFALDPVKGSETRLGNAGAFKGDLMIKPDKQAYLLATSGSFAACPAKAAPVVEAPKATIVTDAEELKAINELFDDAAGAQMDKGLPQNLWEKDAGQLAAILSPWLDEITRFEETMVAPVRGKTKTFTSKYGDQSTASTELARHTGNEYFLEGALYNLQKRLEEWDEYRSGLAEHIAYQGNTYFLLADAQSSIEQAIPLFLKAKPYGDWALRFDPENPLGLQIAAKAEKNADLARAAAADALAKAAWPEDHGDFDFNVPAMKKKILAYFQEQHTDKNHANGARYFAVRLGSGWVPGLTNWLGHILEWRISGYIAITIPEDPDNALIIPVQIGTRTNNKDSGFAKRYFRSDSYKIPIERVTADDPEILEESLKLIGK